MLFVHIMLSNIHPAHRKFFKTACEDEHFSVLVASELRPYDCIKARKRQTTLNLLVFTLCFTLARVNSCFYKYLKILLYIITRCLKL